MVLFGHSFFESYPSFLHLYIDVKTKWSKAENHFQKRKPRIHGVIRLSARISLERNDFSPVEPAALAKKWQDEIARARACGNGRGLPRGAACGGTCGTMMLEIRKFQGFVTPYNHGEISMDVS